MSRFCLLAVICLFFSGPILIVKLPWFIPTIKALENTVAELGIDGTSTYKDHLSSRLRREIFALCLYFAGLFSVAGLVGIATNFIREKNTELAVWSVVFLTSSGLLIFELSISASNAAYSYMIVLLAFPLAIIFLSGASIFLNLRAAYLSKRSRSEN